MENTKYIERKFPKRTYALIGAFVGLNFAALLSPLYVPGLEIREPRALETVLVDSYQSCLKEEDKDFRHILPIGNYTCQEVEDLYFKVKY